MKINSKYSIGDNVWFIFNNKISYGKIHQIRTDSISHEKSEEISTFVEYRFGAIILPEDKLFLTKDDLLSSL